MKLVIRSVLLVMVLVLFVGSIGCASSEKMSDGTSYWATDMYDQFYTTDIERARAEVPFQMVFPTYLPPNTESYLEIVGPLKGSCPEDQVEVNIYYDLDGENAGAGPEISITESNLRYKLPDPEMNPGYRYIELLGVQVVETENTEYWSSVERTYDNPGFLLGWNQKSIYFVVGVYNYSYEEAIKVIESMIRQGL